MTDDLFTRAIFGDIKPRVVERFLQYHKENPEIFQLFQRFANELWGAGIRHYGAAAIFEKIRWHVAVERRSDDFKLNNSMRSGYSRLLIFEDPKFSDFFKTRRSKVAA